MSGAPADDLDREVRTRDEDRWLAARFAPPEGRRRLTALYALNLEIARLAIAVTDPTLAAIRRRWWRDGLEALAARDPAPQHPVLQALAEPVQAGALPIPALETWIEVRASDHDAAALLSPGALEAYLEGSAGGLMRLALGLLGARPRDRAAEQAIGALGRAWGAVRLMEALPALHARQWGRDITRDDLAQLATAALREARAQRRALPADGFPAYGYTALAPLWLRALPTGRPPGPFARRWRLLAAAAFGAFR